ncbi:Alanyl-tRNA synthetase [Hordeum vulgare]|nr:Alanyl-tRNA synthetase [Hordeum vulgare]
MTHNEHQALEQGTVTETSSTDKHLWSRLWKLKVLPRVRVFRWRVLHGILPVEESLKYHHIATVGTCKLCLHAKEDMKHASLDCTHARRFWSAALDWLDIKRPELHPLTWSQDILSNPMFSDSKRAKLVTVMWAIWTSKNNATHDKRELDPALST